jgi:uncharacterized small protein (DUF1192 family)
MVLSEEKLAELKRLALAAPPGKRRAGNVESYHVFVHHPEGLAGPIMGERVLCRLNEHFEHGDDAAFIAACSPDVVLALVAEIERLNAERIKQGQRADVAQSDCGELKDAIGEVCWAPIRPAVEKARSITTERDALRARMAELEAERARLLGWCEAENAATENGESVADCIERGDHMRGEADGA